MRVEELIIDGFKSYAARTVISGWDPQFNAITGLNGSGKSNILDAICFVLGISSMTTVRASNLQDLIYKRGQAGVTKASVTIVFNNHDKSRSPIGFEEYPTITVTRQIILGGSSKYLVNGHKAQQQTVLNLFQSVQLNINNPNFLIMQGKITKVLNMKPAEILSLIEEAAGTRTFEDRKDKAEKTLKKKEVKLAEIRSLLQEEIEPKLEKLRHDKRTFLEFQQVQMDLEKLERVVVAYDFVALRDAYDNVHGRQQSLKDEVDRLEAASAQWEQEVANLAADLEAAKKAREQEVEVNGTIAGLQQRETEMSTALTRAAAARDLSAESEKEERANLAAAEAKLRELGSAADSAGAKLAAAQQEYTQVSSELTELKNRYNEREELLSTLSTGVSATGAVSGGYEAQLAEVKRKLNDEEVAVGQRTGKIESLKRLLNEKKSELAAVKRENEELVARTDAQRQQVAQMESQLASELGFDPSEIVSVKQREREAAGKCEQFDRRMAALKNEVGGLNFDYSRPHANFNDDAVRGVVAQLFELPQENSEKALALQVCAGGRLYNVVVDTANVASDLLERGRLRKRVTIIPLDKIAARRLPRNTIDRAAQLAPNKAHLAIDLIEFEPSLAKAMEYIFGTTFVCADPNTAKKITFDPQIRTRSITVEGDTYDPEGNLSGGSRRQGPSVILKLQQYHSVAKEHREAQKEWRQLRSQLEEMERRMAATKSLSNELRTKKYELELSEKKLANHTSSHLLAQFHGYEAEISELTTLVETGRASIVSYHQQIASIEKDQAEFSSNKGVKLQQLQKEVAKLKKEVESKQKQAEKLGDAFSSMQIDNEGHEAEVASWEKAQAAATSAIADLAKESEASAARVKQTEMELAQVRAALEEERAALFRLDDEINELNQLIKTMQEQGSASKLESQKLHHELEKLDASTSGTQKKLEELVKAHIWLETPHAVDQVCAQYPDVQLDELREQLVSLEEKFTTMKRKVNVNIMTMIENVEKKETSLKGMVRTITKDKSKIVKTIEKLNGYKRDTLNQTYHKVSTDFGEIFAEVLPGAFAKLVPVDMMDVTKGVEVKVRLGEKWKESLVELSGGQRSLIALSLIMALLQFKPAPMYILDEVDAALDLAHTQSIGNLIKTRFKTAQFIVVSLKEGMFNNANCVFRARFQEGTSMVTKM
ncbi:structural maintenance of chromosomes protein 2 [Diutina catenulata]